MSSLKSATSRPWFYGLLALGILVLAVLVSRSLIATAPKAERKPPQRLARLVEVTPVSPGNERVSVSAYGQVEASQRVAISAEVSGTVVEIGDAFVPGQQLAAGAVLVRVDPSNYQVAVESARASLAAAEAELRQEQGRQAVARGDFEVLDLKVTEEERALMLREPQLNAARAAVRTARAALERARLDLQRTTVRAPFDALVLSRDVALGAQVGGANAVLGELALAEPYWITLLVPVGDLRWIETPDSKGEGGSLVEIRDVSQPRESWRGRVIQLLDAVEAQGRRARLLVEVDPIGLESGDRLLLGSYVEARIQGSTLESVYALDPGWLYQDQVWVVREQRLHPVDLEVLHRDESVVLARGELHPGESVVSSRLSSAVEGMRVRFGDTPLRGEGADRD